MGVRFARVGTIARGKRDEGVAFAASISDYVRENLGVDVTWGVQMGGTLGTVHWHVDYNDMAHLEQAMGWTMSDAGYKKLVDDAADLFDGPTEDTIIYTM